MKKLLVMMMAVVTTMSLTACGGESETTSSDEVVVAEDQVADEQEKADQDYAQLQTFMNGITENYAAQEDVAVMLEEVRNGEKEESDILEAYKQMAEKANTLLADVENATWLTNYYDDKVSALETCVSALALYQQTVYDASAENDNDKLEEAVGYYDDYDAALTVFLDLMGVE